jgi:uncharacterized protein affecting Mg2+/Co2+ transport
MGSWGCASGPSCLAGPSSPAQARLAFAWPVATQNVTEPTIRVLVADDQTVVREGLGSRIIGGDGISGRRPQTADGAQL